ADAVAGDADAVAPGVRRARLRGLCRRAQPYLHRHGDPRVARRQRAQRPADVRLLAALSVSDFHPHLGRPAGWRCSVTAELIVDAKGSNERERRMRARNRALALVLFALAALFFAISFVRLGGG